MVDKKAFAERQQVVATGGIKLQDESGPHTSNEFDVNESAIEHKPDPQPCGGYLD